MKNGRLVGIMALLAIECAASFTAGAVAYGMVQECKAKQAVMEEPYAVEDIGVRGAWFKFSANDKTVQSEVVDSEATEMLAKALPIQMAFQRVDGLFLSRSSVALPAAAGTETKPLAGDFLYLPESGKLAVVIDPAKVPKNAVVLGHMGKETADQLGTEEMWTITLGR